MARHTVIPQKKRGPPATGKGTPIMVRIQPKALAALDGWIERQDDAPSRPEAIRRILGRSLTKMAPRQTSKETASKAAALAARELNQLGDPAAAPEERASRKRRLIAGPKEFRDIRGDQPKKKG
jgi:hypothetical protein